VQKIHKDFGIRLDFNQFTKLPDVIAALEQYGLIVVDDIPGYNDVHQLKGFFASFSEILDYSQVFLKLEKCKKIYIDGCTEVEIQDTYGTNSNMFLHQDGFWYDLEKSFTGMSVDLSNVPVGDKVADTVFYTNRRAIADVSKELVDWFKTLVVSHCTMLNPSHDFLSRRQEKILELYNNYTGRADQLKIFVDQYNKSIRESFGPGEFNVDHLLQEDDHGLWLNWSPSGHPWIVNLNAKENQWISDFLNSHVLQVKYLYCHSWSPNQVVLWDNKGLIHSRLDNSTTKEKRRMFRIQFKGDQR
jgi:hypothetical protein